MYYKCIYTRILRWLPDVNYITTDELKSEMRLVYMDTNK